MYTSDDQLMNIFFIVREFYSLMAIEAIAKVKPFKHSHERWLEDFNQYKNDYISKTARIIYEYTVCAVVSELRHCNHSNYYLRAIDTGYSSSKFLKCLDDYTAESILKTGVKMFNTDFNKWNNMFGGHSWLLIAKAGLMYGKIPNIVFLDHCVDLQHNCGTYFDKRLGFFYLPNGIDFTHFLDDKKHSVSAQEEIVPVSFELKKLVERGKNLHILPKYGYKKKEYKCEKHPLFVCGCGKSRWELEIKIPILDDDLGDYDFFDAINSYTPIKFGKKDLNKKRYYRTPRYYSSK